MNKERQGNQNMDRSFLLLNEISKGGSLSQRDLSKELDIALELVNSCLKNLIAKGYVTVKAIPARRYVYCLIPKGFGKKSSHSYQKMGTMCDSVTVRGTNIWTGQGSEAQVRHA